MRWKSPARMLRGCNWKSGVRFLRANILEVIPINSVVIPTEDFSPSGGTRFSMFRDFDFVVSNPPYVGFSEADKVQKSVFEFEPRMAVFAGENGLDVICPLIEQAHDALKPGGWLALEIGYSMRDAVVNSAASHNVGRDPRGARPARDSAGGGGEKAMRFNSV